MKLLNTCSVAYMRSLQDGCIDLVVTDPFMGTGAAALACIHTNRDFIGVEIDNGYFAIAEEKYHQDGHC